MKLYYPTGIKREADDDVSPTVGSVKIPRVEGDVSESLIAEIVETISDQSQMLGPDVSIFMYQNLRTYALELHSCTYALKSHIQTYYISVFSY